MADLLSNDVVMTGEITFSGTVNLPANTVTSESISSSVPIDASKLVGSWREQRQMFAPGTEIVAVTELLGITSGATGEVVGIEAAITTQATGADRTVTVDLEKSTSGGAFATVMTTTVDITNATVIRTAVAGVVDATKIDLVDGDILQLVVTVAGAASAQAAGLIVSVHMRDDPA